ncbi:tyrosine-type recombinase/integrase, partial [Clostridium perfringens]
LKHTRAVDMLDAGFNLEDIKYLLGHKNIANTVIYAQFSSNYKSDFFDRLDRMG